MLPYSMAMIPPLLTNKSFRTKTTKQTNTWQYVFIQRMLLTASWTCWDMFTLVKHCRLSCVPCSLSELPATLLVETHNRLLPSTSWKAVHQYQLINLLKSYVSILNFTIASNATNSCELFLTVTPFVYKVLWSILC